MGIEIIPFVDGDGAAVRQAWEITDAGWNLTFPDIPHETYTYFRRMIRHPAYGFAHEWAIGCLDGAPAGYLQLRMPLLDNPENAEMELWVAPEHRRRGVGRALYRYAADLLQARGRKRIAGETVEGRPGGEFCEAIGAVPALRETCSRLDVTAVDQGRLDSMAAEAWTHADGYRTVRWQGVPPEAYIGDVAYLESRMVTDAPLGDLDWEPEKIDAERVREAERRRTERGIRRFHAGAVQVAGDRMVGLTTLSGEDELPTHLWQSNTIVDPLHRGHRLGTIVKLENLAYAREHRPELTTIHTANATSNEYMLSINRAMGFRQSGVWIQWQKVL